ncbi:MAG: YdcF family protein [Clostridia bacterium]|nr:YdcF family protein [Clostridia bacterium]
MKKTKKLFIAVVVFFLTSFTLFEAVIITAPYYYKPQKSDCILILGYALKDGYHPDEWLEMRLSKGLELFNRGFGEFIIVSGGKGPKDQIPVGESMRNWLLERGVPDNKIVVEDRSSTTFTNIDFSKKIIRDKEKKRVLVVTSDFHLFRSMLIAKDNLEYCSGASAPSSKPLKKTLSYIRESAAIIKYYIFDRINR